MDPNRAFRLLREPVPQPRRPVAKPQQSWQQLKPGQRLRSREAIVVGVIGVAVGTEWVVTSVDSLGAVLSSTTGLVLRWTTPWDVVFDRIKASRKRKEPTQ